MEIPVSYGGPDGPDLEAVAAHLGLAPAEVIQLHQQPLYRVLMLGFTAGFPYLGTVPPRLALPRRASPRVRVPAGSVAIAERFTGIYPRETPGGWHLIGRTEIPLFDPTHDPPARLKPGDFVRFRSVPSHGATGAAKRSGGTRRRPEASPAHGGRPVLEVREPGWLTTVQDLGRIGYQRFGVPPAGALDPLSLSVANWLVGNNEGLAGIEMTGVGPTFEVLAETVVATGGAWVDWTIDGVPAPLWTTIRIRPGQVLRCGTARRGFRAYLAVAGGFTVPLLLGSRSTCLPAGFGGLDGRTLAPGDHLAAGNPLVPIDTVEGRTLPPDLWPAVEPPEEVRVILGPQTEAFSHTGMKRFREETYVVSAKADRMGIRFEGPAIEHRRSADIPSDGLPLGAIQVPGDGQPILLLADRQTTGGYAKIAAAITADLRRLAHLRPGDRLRFRIVGEETARSLLREAVDTRDALCRRIRSGLGAGERRLLLHDRTEVLRIETRGPGAWQVRVGRRVIPVQRLDGSPERKS